MFSWFRSLLVGRESVRTPRRTGRAPVRKPRQPAGSGLEPLERREVMSGAGAPIASFPGVVSSTKTPTQVVIHFDAGELSSDRSSSILLGLYAKPSAGSTVVPAITGVTSGSGRQSRASYPQRGPDSSAQQLFVTSVPLRSGQAQDITVNVGGQGQTTGNFDLDFFLPGDANRDSVVDATDLALVQGIYGAKEGESNFNPRADFNGDGRIGPIDLRMARANQGARAVYTPVVVPAATPAPTTTAPATTAPATTPPATATPAPATTAPATTAPASGVAYYIVPAAQAAAAGGQGSIPVGSLIPVYYAPPTATATANGVAYYVGQPVVQPPASGATGATG